MEPNPVTLFLEERYEKAIETWLSLENKTIDVYLLVFIFILQLF